MDMQENNQNHDRSESSPSPQDLAGMIDLDLDADDPVFHQTTRHQVGNDLEEDVYAQEFIQEDEECHDDSGVIDVEATSPGVDPFGEEFNPEKNRTLVGLQSSGFAKTAVVVGGGFMLLTGGAMVFQNQIPKPQVAQETKKADPADEKISSAQAAADKAQQSESETKAQLALAKQKDSLAQANNSNGNSSKTSSPTTTDTDDAQQATVTGTKSTNTSKNTNSPVTVSTPATVANQNIPTAQLAATGNSTANKNPSANVESAAPRKSSEPVRANVQASANPQKLVASRQQTTQIAPVTALPLARSASSIRPVISPVANKPSAAQALPTQATLASKTATQSIIPVAAPGVTVAQKTKTNSRAAQVAKAALREPQADNYRFGETASRSNSPAPAADTRRPLGDGMRNDGNNLNRDTTLAIVRAPGSQDNTNGNLPSGGFGTNRPLGNTPGTLASAQNNTDIAPPPSLTPSLTSYLQRSNQSPAAPSPIAQVNPAAVAAAANPQLGLPVAPVPRVNGNPMDSIGSQTATSIAALSNVGERLSQKLTALAPLLNAGRTAIVATPATIASDVSTTSATLGQGIQKYQRFQPIGQMASADVDNSSSRALLSSRPAFAHTREVANTGGVDSRGLVATRAPLPLQDSNLPANHNLTAKSILVGTSAKASTVTPILWNAGGNSGAKFIIKLDEPIRDSSGQVALPAGTQLVAIAKPSTVSAEMADLEVVGVVIQGEEFAPPAGILTIRNDQNGLIVGQDYFQRNNQIAGRDSMIFLTGALSTVGRVLNQPTNTFTSSGLNGTVTSSSNGQPNILGAVLEGGFRDLPATWTARNQQAIQEIASKPNVYQLPQGSSVRVFVNQTLNF